MIKISFYTLQKNQIISINCKYKRKIFIFYIIITIIIILKFLCFYKINKNLSLHNFIINFTNSKKNINFANICCLLKKDENTILNNKNLIYISMSLDNNHIYPTLISMISFLENNDKDKNLLIYYLLLSNDFIKEKINIFESLKNNYDVRINYYIIPNIFKNWKKWRDNTDSHYYKLLIPMLFQNLERILYLDGDTLAYKDISELYNFPLLNNYIAAPPSPFNKMPKKFEIKSKIYINVGVILINIKKIRKCKKDLELLYYTSKYSHLCTLPEQDLTNYVFRNKIGLLPFKYGIYLYGNIKIFEKYHTQKYKIIFKKEEILEAINDPVIVHLVFCEPKIWWNHSKNRFGYNIICKKYQKDFYYYANKTDYYSKIVNLYRK